VIYQRTFPRPVPWPTGRNGSTAAVARAVRDRGDTGGEDAEYERQ
jgi:hypothetical protein